MVYLTICIYHFIHRRTVAPCREYVTYQICNMTLPHIDLSYMNCHRYINAMLCAVCMYSVYNIKCIYCTVSTVCTLGVICTAQKVLCSMCNMYNTCNADNLYSVKIMHNIYLVPCSQHLLNTSWSDIVLVTNRVRAGGQDKTEFTCFNCCSLKLFSCFKNTHEQQTCVKQLERYYI